MNKVIVGFLFAFISVFSFGQEKIKRNELSFSVIKLATSQFENYLIPIDPFGIDAGINIVYKNFVRDNLYFRACQSYYRYPNMYFEIGLGNSITDQEITSSIGLEFRYPKHSFKKYNFYTGFDICGLINIEKFQISDEFKFRRTDKGIGLLSFAGFNIYPNKRLVLTLESAMMLGFMKNTLKETGPNNAVSYESYGDWEQFGEIFLLRTVSIGWRY